MKNKIIIGTRSSELALWQSNFIKSEIEKKNPGIEVELKLVKTKGDKILDVALSKIGDKGLFTKELEIELLNGSIDIAVHSLKDLQTDIPEGLELSAVTKRHDPRDVLIAREKGKGLKDIQKNGKLATGSLRRKSQALHLRPDLSVYDLRGNVNTRLQKFLDSDWDAIILACAGVERIGLDKHISSYIGFDEILPAVGQGALGIETSAENEFVHEILKSISDPDTFAAARCERSFLKTLGGGCQTPIAAYAEIKDGTLTLDGLVATLDGKQVYRDKISGAPDAPEILGAELARKLLDIGAWIVEF